ncbi:MAG: MarR family transcriptional regulator [Candidatus Gastranaerophilales bacterium]|nr:MarR family transcriptional regulator [Candidatus Gastranaerophilales bacterium]
MYTKSPKNLFGHTLVETGRQIKMYNLKMFADNNFEITPEQFLILSILDDNSNLHQMQLCELLFKDRSNMARLIGVLEKKGLVIKQQSVDKRLVNKIQITEKGKKLKNLIVPLIKESRNKILNEITDDELTFCIEILKKIQNNLI